MPFYELRKGDQIVWILGTFHAGRSGESLSSGVVEKLLQSRALVLELSDTEIFNAAMLMASALCADECLKNEVTPLMLNRLKEAYGNLFLASGGIERAPLWLVSIMGDAADIEKSGLKAELGTEMLLRLAAAPRGMPVIGLETAAEQFAVFRLMPNAMLREMVEVTVLQTPEAKRIAGIQALHAMWKEGDADKLFHYYLSEAKKIGIKDSIMQYYNGEMITKRNRRMVDRMKPYITEGRPLFVAVGALHLGGEEGILSLLKKEGFTVVRQ
ncbi:MAG: TraB/GumN family protein [Burkholderiales bacterium]|nr:TraB/GumN family protein [Burkholderiales bacterium]